MRLIVTTLAALVLLCGLAAAQTEPSQPSAPAGSQGPAADAPAVAEIRIELNKLEVSGDVCLGYFILSNGTPEPLKELQIDVFFFDRQEVILRRVALTFLDVRSGRAKVVLFELDLACDDIGRLLVNEVIACSKADGSALEACADRLAVTSRAQTQFVY